MPTVRKYLVEYHNGLKIVHYDGCIQPGDMSLCASDLMGDQFLGWKQAVETNKPVDCPHCLRIVKHCKSIKIKPA